MTRPFGQGPNSLTVPSSATVFVGSPAGLSSALAAGVDLRVKYQWPNVTNNNLILLGTAANAASCLFTATTWSTNGAIFNVSNGTTLLSGGWLSPAQMGNPAFGDWVTLRWTYSLAAQMFSRGFSVDNGATWTMYNQAGAASSLPNNPAWTLRTSLASTLPITWAWIDLRQIDGTPLAQCDLTYAWPGTTYTDAEHNTWRLNGTGWTWQGPLTRVWDGTTWHLGYVNGWDGSQWQLPKAWTGSTWVET